jgi:GT2 family glycosyltransferase
MIERWSGRNGLQHEVLRAGDSGVGKHPWLTVILADENRGFAAGNNLGIGMLRHDPACTHILLLNNDTLVAPDFFAKLYDALEIAPDAGLLTGTIYEDREDRSTVWYAGGREIPWRAHVVHELSVPEEAAPVATGFISGCVMLISRSVLDSIGELAECYAPLYWEDAEYSHRTIAAGFSVLYAPQAVVFHRVGGTVGTAKASPRITYAQNRHRVLFVRRNYRGLKRVIALGYLAATKPTRAIAEILRGNPRIGAAIFRGFADGMTSADASE